MGSSLSAPITDKSTANGGDDRFLYAVSSMQGWRNTMEDAHATILNLLDGEDNSEDSDAKHPRHSFFAVYDGHGGSSVAEYSEKHLHNKIIQDPEFTKGNYRAAIKNGFLETDVALRADDPNPDVGCTAVTVLVTDKMMLYCGNAGDSRAVLSSQGNAVALSDDHKPTNDGESARIVAAGGYVESKRVNGNLALSRAVGDFEFKKNTELGPEDQAVTVNPDIMSRELVPKEDDFLVVACDGIWDCMSNDEVVDFVMAKISEDKTLSEICELMMEYCLADDTNTTGYGRDNMTVVVIAVVGNGVDVMLTYSEWVEQVKKRWEMKEDKSVFKAQVEEVVVAGEVEPDDSEARLKELSGSGSVLEEGEIESTMESGAASSTLLVIQETSQVSEDELPVDIGSSANVTEIVVDENVVVETSNEMETNLTARDIQEETVVAESEEVVTETVVASELGEAFSIEVVKFVEETVVIETIEYLTEEAVAAQVGSPVDSDSMEFVIEETIEEDLSPVGDAAVSETIVQEFVEVTEECVVPHGDEVKGDAGVRDIALEGTKAVSEVVIARDVSTCGSVARESENVESTTTTTVEETVELLPADYAGSLGVVRIVEEVVVVETTELVHTIPSEFGVGVTEVRVEEVVTVETFLASDSEAEGFANVEEVVVVETSVVPSEEVSRDVALVLTESNDAVADASFGSVDAVEDGVVVLIEEVSEVSLSEVPVSHTERGAYFLL
ncbi:Protein phosphatase 2C 2 [Podochytrium sp. JEL0797]|nr:Protein phosphatase 2C 2 [Podochytrium sp. JEL0797]